MAGRGEFVKKVAEAITPENVIKVTDDVRAPFQELGFDPRPREGGGIDLFDQAGEQVGTYTSVEEALAFANKPKAEAGIKAYHGSPYKFEEFKTEAIGTGEGAQVYGHGLYFAEEPDVARGYRKDVTAQRAADEILPINPEAEAELNRVLNFADTALANVRDTVMFEYKNPTMEDIQKVARQKRERSTNEYYERAYETIERLAAEGKFTLPEQGTDLNAIYSKLTGAKATGLDYQKAEIIEQIMIDGDVLGVIDRQKEFNQFTPEAYAWFEKEIAPTFKAPGALYEVNIKSNPEELLNWDKPFSEQTQKVKDALSDIFDERSRQIKERSQIYTRPVDEVIQQQTGADLYSRLAETEAYTKWVKEGLASGTLKMSETNTPASVSKFLESRGIKGITYADQMSRGSDGGTKNFVIFDPRLIEIAKKYSVAIPVASTMLYQEDTYASTLDAMNASVDSELNESQVNDLRNYVETRLNPPVERDVTVVDTATMNLEPVPPVANPTFQRDDASGKILNARQNADLTPAQKARMRMEKEQEGKTIGEMAAGAAETVGAVAGDIFGGVIEAPRQALAGFLDATAEMAEIMESIIPLGGEPIKIEAQPRTITGAGVRAISQFLTGFIPAMRGLKAAGVTFKSAPFVAGAFADAAGFDAHEARLSDLVQTVPELQNPVTEYLQSDPNDSEAEGRFKNAVEGLLLGGAVEGFVKSVKFIKTRKAAKETAAEEGKTVNEAIQSDEQISQRLATTNVPEQEFIPFQEQAANNSVEFEFQTGSTKADPEAANNINLSNIQTTDDVNRLIEMVAEADAPNINAARREKITNDELPKLADDLGMTVQDLLNRRQGQAFNAEQILAARKILIASGENLIKLSKKAATGGDLDLALFRRAMAQHQAIQQQVSGMTAEAGRALQSFNIIAASSREQERLIKEALEASGGMEVNQKMAQMMSELDDPTKLGKFVKDASKARNIDMLYEVWINGLLSSPTTHMVNVLSNTMVAALTVGERKVASMIGSNIPAGEAGAQLKGMVDGARDGMRLAWQALKTGEPTDVLEKVEVDKRRAISGESLELSGMAGRLADYLGEAVRIPGRLLTTGDAFFKAVGYRMELHAQAYRQAFNEGLRDEAAAKRVLELIDNPPENIKMAAIDASRYQTFTNQLGPAGKAVENLRNKMPYARVIMPFVRTPVNIMSYTFERTPLAPLSASFREEIAAGGARRDLALGKLVMGSTIMAISADLTLSGHLTGAGPTDRDAKNILRATGWQPYSVKVGDTYYAYNRLDPTGALLGLAADMAEIMGQTTEAEAQQIAAAAALSVAQNMASKTYMSGVVDFMDAFFSSSTDPEANNYKLNSWLSRMAGSMVPSSIANIERVMSPEMSATYSMLDKIKSRIPGYSDTLPPRRNIFGEPVVLEGGIGPDIMSPIYTSTAKDDPIADELVKQQSSISMPRRVVNGVELDPQQYDKYILLYSGQDNKGMKGVPLKKKLKELFATPQYKNATDGPEGGKSLLIQSVFTAYRDTAKAQLISEDPRLEGDIMTLKRERIEKLTGR